MNIESKVICIGSMGKDIFFPVSTGIVLDAENEADGGSGKQFCFGYGGKVHVEDRFMAPGGCACNVAIGLARLGIDVSSFGNIGNDTDGEWILKVLKDNKVDVKKIKVVENDDTDLSVIIVDANVGERTIFVNRDVGEQLKLSKDIIKDFEWCFMGSLYGDDIQDNMSVIHGGLSRGDIKLAYNPGGKNIKQDEGVVLDLIHHAELVFVNKIEAKEIVLKFNLSYNEGDTSSEEYLLAIIKEHMKSDTGIVVLTDGLRGAWAYDGKDIYHTDTLNKPVHDSTGAGDAFASGFFAGLLQGHKMDVCMQWGSVNGNSVIDYYGSQKGLKDIKKINDDIELFPVENKKKK